MEAVRLFLLKVILTAILFNIFVATNANTLIHNNIPSSSASDVRHRTHFEHHSNRLKQLRSSRNFQEKNWSSKASNYNALNSLPPYLVYNRKLGSYYPYYPKQNSIRRNMVKNRSRQQKWNH
ncbi:unnamed protein product [Parnassius apollo]|uniref:(apollo) hypothetical protein n=1 Tax=Parnassius apollo TaxID=110799 RepID=A0A8S3Y0Y3_PARAO|nr:unnamed protein product [Parnassius apollo]